jgi:hypothetical protein
MNNLRCSPDNCPNLYLTWEEPCIVTVYEAPECRLSIKKIYLCGNIFRLKIRREKCLLQYISVGRLRLGSVMLRDSRDS